MKINFDKEEFQQYRFTLKQLVTREVKRKYARSYLGIVWSVLNPLLTMAVMSMIFSTIFKRAIENFPVYYMTGIIFWNMFALGTNSAMTALVDNRLLLMRVKVPKQTFVLSRIFTAFTNFGYTFVAYVLLIIVFQVKPNIYMLLYPIDVFFLLLFTMGIGYVLSILYVFFGDISYLYSVVLTLWMYMCALFYPIERVSAPVQWIIRKNPIFCYIDFARKIVMYRQMPELALWLKIILFGTISFGFGYWFFKRNENQIMQKI